MGTKELKMKSVYGCDKMDSIPLFYMFLNEEVYPSMLSKIKAFTCNLPLPNYDNCCNLSTSTKVKN
jgi:hypothetical protein